MVLTVELEWYGVGRNAAVRPPSSYSYHRHPSIIARGCWACIPAGYIVSLPDRMRRTSRGMCGGRSQPCVEFIFHVLLVTLSPTVSHILCEYRQLCSAPPPMSLNAAQLGNTGELGSPHEILLQSNIISTEWSSSSIQFRFTTKIPFFNRERTLHYWNSFAFFLINLLFHFCVDSWHGIRFIQIVMVILKFPFDIPVTSIFFF